MALPIPPGGDVSSWVEQRLLRLVPDVANVEEIGSIAEEAGGILLDASAMFAGAAGGTAAVEGAEVGAGGLLAVFGGWAVILVVVVVIALIFILVEFRKAIGSIGLGIGSKVEHLLPSPALLDGPLHWAARRGGEASRDILSGFATAVHWALQIPSTTPIGMIEHAIYAQVEPVKHELDHLWGWVSDINAWLDNVSHQTHGVPAPHVSPNIPLQEQIDNLKDIQARQAVNQQILKDNQAALHQDLANLNDRVHQLASLLGPQRATNAGYQDVSAQLKGLEDQLGQLEKNTATRVDANTDALQALAPLGLLLPAGARGLENLVRLEDKPCLCPELPGLPNMLGTALAAIHGLKDGF